MRVLGLQGSPRLNGNTAFLLDLILEEARRQGAVTHKIDVENRHIEPCREYITCEKRGFCPIKDDMKSDIYARLRAADVVIPASPVFFYNVTAQLKALIDRSQTLWARKYRLNLTDPNRGMRRGLMVSVGATKGKNLFVGIDLTAQYFFDAVGASFHGTQYYWRIEHPGDMAAHPSVRADVQQTVTDLLAPFRNRRRILFACRENACRSQMAGAFAQQMAGDRCEVLTGGSAPAEKVNPLMETAMAEKGIDMGFRVPHSIDEALAEGPPERVITMGCGETCPTVPGAAVEDWDIPDPAEGNLELMSATRDAIAARVAELIANLDGESPR
jgi:multimeric flavodoxin WrbA/protein-tyrosine-phosphatase